MARPETHNFPKGYIQLIVPFSKGSTPADNFRIIERPKRLYSIRMNVKSTFFVYIKKPSA
jgi:hypothetical protein